MKVLVTNDDGFESPLYQLFIQHLEECSWISELRLVVPANEQSWIGSAITKHSRINAQTTIFGKHTAYLIEGTPSDAAAIGCHAIFDDEPDLVLSGVNFGVNAGVSFCYSSGTLGAARTASALGIPAIACSAFIEKSKVFPLWSKKDLAGLEAHGEYLDGHVQSCVRLIEACLEKDPFKHHTSKVDYISINTPIEKSDADAVQTRVESNRYLPLFKRIDESTFVHDFKGFNPDHKDNGEEEELPGDLSTLYDGKPSITYFTLNAGDYRKPLD